MKIQLPLENWADLLPFVPRRQLVALLFKLCDPQFATILQYCLNEVGHIALGHLRIRAPKANDPIGGPILEVCPEMGSDWTPGALETPIPDEPIPKNVHHFKSLYFRYFDSLVLRFLQKFHQHQNALLANVNFTIHFAYYTQPMKKLQPMLAQILPLIGDNINSLKLDNQMHEFCLQCNGNNDEFSEVVTTMLTRTRILSTEPCGHLPLDCYCRWLYAPRMDGRPRMLHISIHKEDLDFINLIKKDFLMAKHPVTFFVRVRTCKSGCIGTYNVDLGLEDIRLENAETNESLLMVNKCYGEFLISRFPKEADGAKWIQAYGQEILDFGGVDHDRTIFLGIMNLDIHH